MSVKLTANVDMVNYFGGGYVVSVLTNVTLTMPEENKGILKDWIQRTNCSISKKSAMSFAIDDKIYVCGGENSVYLNAVECYDTLTNTWSTKANLPESKSSGVGFAINGKGYVQGGRRGTTSYSSLMHEYDPTSNTWTEKTSGLVIAWHAVFVINGEAYLCGGYSRGSNISTVTKYDPLTDTYTNKTSIPEILESSGGTSIGTNGYLVGGNAASTYKDKTFEFNSLTNTWSIKKAFPTVVNGLCAVSYGDTIYALGGRNSATVFKTMYAYSQKTDTWQQKNDMLFARAQANAHIIGNKIFVMNGFDLITYSNTVETAEILKTEIWYTTDGTDPAINETPTVNAVKYTEPFDLPLSNNQLEPTQLKYCVIPVE